MIKVGIIGVGRIGVVHAKALSKLGNVEIYAIADPVVADIETYAQSMQIPNAYKDYKKIIDDKNIDAVLICTPSDTHYAISIEAIASGKHVFCEKPVDLEISRVKDIQKRVDAENGLVYMVGFNRRFDKEFMALKNSIEVGKIGKVELVQITSRDPSPPPVSYVKQSGGLFSDMMIHDLDMAYYLVNQEAKSIFAVGNALVDPKIKTEGQDIDTAIVTIEFESGAMCVITNSRRAAYGYDQRAEVHGSQGCIMNGNHFSNHSLLMVKEGLISEKPLDFFIERYMDAYVLEISKFVEAIETKGKPPVSVIDALRSLVLAKAAAISLKEGRKILISEFMSDK